MLSETKGFETEKSSTLETIKFLKFQGEYVKRRMGNKDNYISNSMYDQSHDERPAYSLGTWCGSLVSNLTRDFHTFWQSLKVIRNAAIPIFLKRASAPVISGRLYPRAWKPSMTRDINNASTVIPICRNPLTLTNFLDRRSRSTSVIQKETKFIGYRGSGELFESLSSNGISGAPFDSCHQSPFRKSQKLRIAGVRNTFTWKRELDRSARIYFISDYATPSHNSPSPLGTTALWELRNGAVEAFPTILAGEIPGALNQAVHVHRFVELHIIGRVKTLLPGGLHRQLLQQVVPFLEECPPPVSHG
nr:hypothetical protein Iba_chr03aCG0580 [Ipomoea batatas]